MRRSALTLLAALLALPAAAADLATAERLLQRGDVSGALIEARTRTVEAPDDVAAHELFIDLMLATGQASTARQRYVQRAADRPQDADSHYLLGRVSGDPGASEAAFRKALVLAPGHPRALTGIAAVHRSRGELDSAVSAYEQALRARPELSEAWAGLRAVAMMRRDASGLSRVSLRSIQADPGEPQNWLAAAASTPAQATELLDRALQRHPNVPDLYVALGRAAFERQQWDTAAAAYSRALALGTGDLASVHVEAALVDEVRSGALDYAGAQAILEVRGMTDPLAALDRLDRLVVAHPHSGWARLVRGNLRAARGSAQLAEEDLRAAITRMPSTPEAWSALGSFLLGQRRPAEARPLLDGAAQARQGDVSIVVAAAIAAADAGDPATAEAELRAAMARFNGSVGPPLGLARLLLSTGRADDAFTVLEAAIRRRPDVQLAGALVAAAQEAGRPEDAVAILDRLADQTGDPRLRKAADGLRAARAE